MTSRRTLMLDANEAVASVARTDKTAHRVKSPPSPTANTHTKGAFYDVFEPERASDRNAGSGIISSLEQGREPTFYPSQ